MWAVDNAGLLPAAGNTRSIRVSDLQDGGYIENALKSPMTNEVYNSETKVEISSDNGSDYEYTVQYGEASEVCQK